MSEPQGLFDLQGMFDGFNRLYFGASLLRYRVLRRGLGGGGTCDEKRRIIIVHRDVRGEEVVAMLLRLMCCIGCPDDDPGYCWEAQVRRLLPQRLRSGLRQKNLAL